MTENFPLLDHDVQQFLIFSSSASKPRALEQASPTFQNMGPGTRRQFTFCRWWGCVHVCVHVTEIVCMHMHVYEYMHACLCMHVSVYACECVCMWVCMHLSMWVCICVYVCVHRCMCVYACIMCVLLCVCVHACMCACVYACMCVVCMCVYICMSLGSKHPFTNICHKKNFTPNHPNLSPETH